LQNTGVPLSKIAWLTTVVILLIAAVLVLISGYLGYFGVLVAVALAAAVNLR
jgi:ABC-type Fe3+-siderophore transport system permease subunit